MLNKRLTICALLLFFLGITELQAQESANAAGSNASGSKGSLSYSIGQVFYSTYSGTNTSIAEGVQQAHEISVIAGIKSDKSIGLAISVYPNPVNDNLTLMVEASTLLIGQPITYQLYDMNGKLLQNKMITGTQTRIAMSSLVPATYFIKVIRGKKAVKTFKINKK